MNSLIDLFKSLQGLIKEQPLYFVFLIILTAILYPIYQQHIHIDPLQYISIVVIILLSSLIWLFAVEFLKSRSNRNSLPSKNDRLDELKQTVDNEFRQLKSLVVKNCSASKIRLIEPNRQDLTDYFWDLIEKSNKIDIVAFTGESFTNLIKKIEKDEPEKFEKFKDKILNQSGRFRILFLEYPPSKKSNINDNDLSIYWQHRAKADGIVDISTFQEKVTEIKRYWLSFKDNITDQYNQSNKSGGLTIQYYSHIPCYAYFRADNTIFIGLYLSFKPGKESPNFEILNENSSNTLYAELKSDFSNLLNKDAKTLIKISKEEMYPK